MAMSKARIHRAAKAAHEAVRILAESHGQTHIPKWDELEGSNSAWMEGDTLKRVESLANGEAPPNPEAEHKRWMTERASQGWTWGPTRDNDQKKNPLMAPFGSLPQFEKSKDAMMVEVALAALGS